MRELRGLGLAASISVMALSACAPKVVSLPPAPNLQPRLETADALLRLGCFDCLTDALREYDAARTAPRAPAAIVDAATAGAVRAALLLDLRERELGMS